MSFVCKCLVCRLPPLLLVIIFLLLTISSCHSFQGDRPNIQLSPVCGIVSNRHRERPRAEAERNAWSDNGCVHLHGKARGTSLNRHTTWGMLSQIPIRPVSADYTVVLYNGYLTFKVVNVQSAEWNDIFTPFFTKCVTFIHHFRGPVWEVCHFSAYREIWSWSPE